MKFLLFSILTIDLARGLTLPGSDFLENDITVEDYTHYRLPVNLIPESYQIALKPYLDPADQVK